MKKETMGMMIAAKRKELGMTQLELAEQMGVTDKAVSKWERDLIPRAVCVAMGVAVAVLSILGQIDAQKAAVMLGIGVACAGIALLEK